MTVDDITREDFEAYERVRRAGDTNMCDVKLVEMLTLLDREQILVIMRNYKELSKKFPMKEDSEEWDSFAEY